MCTGASTDKCQIAPVERNNIRVDVTLWRDNHYRNSSFCMPVDKFSQLRILNSYEFLSNGGSFNATSAYIEVSVGGVQAGYQYNFTRKDRPFFNDEAFVDFYIVEVVMDNGVIHDMTAGSLPTSSQFYSQKSEAPASVKYLDACTLGKCRFGFSSRPCVEDRDCAIEKGEEPENHIFDAKIFVGFSGTDLWRNQLKSISNVPTKFQTYTLAMG